MFVGLRLFFLFLFPVLRFLFLFFGLILLLFGRAGTLKADLFELVFPNFKGIVRLLDFHLYHKRDGVAFHGNADAVRRFYVAAVAGQLFAHFFILRLLIIQTTHQPTA